MGDAEAEDDLFADLYDADDNPQSNGPSAAPPSASFGHDGMGNEPSVPQSAPESGLKPPSPSDVGTQAMGDSGFSSYDMMGGGPPAQSPPTNFGGDPYSQNSRMGDQGFPATVGIKEDGKMFIGGLNWETTDQSLRDYFAQFGEVLECTVMRDGASGRSRGFGFLTFKDPRTVNTVMVKEHYLDGKIIDPKRAIPRDEQEKTSKIFVGGVSQDTTEREFEEFFGGFGRVIDATLMMDKDTGRPRGFGFVTFEGEAAVEATLSRPLEIHGKPIEVKRAQPRGNIRDDDDGGGRHKYGRRGQNDRYGRGHENQAPNPPQQAQSGDGGQQNTMSPAMMAQYWQRMQQYFSYMAQNLAQNQGMGGNMPAGMNPMMQQMMAAQMRNQGGGSNDPNQAAMNAMNNPAMVQQMQQQMVQPQQQQQQSQQGQQGQQGGYPQQSMSPMGGGVGNRPAYTAQEQLAFEQRKYEQQQGRRGGSQGAQSSWEGMYDDVPPPSNGSHGGGRGRGSRGGPGTPQPQSQGQAPANAPTGPKNAGKPGANYRGGGRGGHRGYHPYSRN